MGKTTFKLLPLFLVVGLSFGSELRIMTGKVIEVKEKGGKTCHLKFTGKSGDYVLRYEGDCTVRIKVEGEAVLEGPEKLVLKKGRAKFLGKGRYLVKEGEFVAPHLTLQVVRQRRPWGVFVFAGYHEKEDSYYREVYQGGILPLGLGIEYQAARNLSFSVTGELLNKEGRTPLAKKKTTLQQVPLLFMVKVSQGERFKIFLSFGPGVLWFREKSYLGEVKDSLWGVAGSVGVTREISRTLFFRICGRYLWFKKRFESLGENQSLGGGEILASLGVKF